MAEVLTASVTPQGSHPVRALLTDPIFKQASALGLARLIPYTTERQLVAGEYLYKAGQPAHALYFVLDGAVRLVTKKQQDIQAESHRLGEEAATDFATYLTDAIAQTPLRVLVLPRNSLAILFEAIPALKAEFYFSLMQTFAGEHLHHAATSPMAETAPATPVQVESGLSLLGWFLVFLAPILVLSVGQGWGLEKNALYFVAIFSSTVVMWVFNLMDEYIPGIFALLATLAMDLVPIPVILSGMASDGFMLALSVLGLGAVIVGSGLSYRLLLLLMLRLPNTPIWQNGAILGVGFLLTPLIPSINGRVALVSPFLADMLEILRQKLKGVSANQLAVSAFTGVSLLSAIFLSSKSVNFVILELLPDQIQDQFQWLGWLQASVVTALVLIGIYVVMAATLLRGQETSQLSRPQLVEQLRLLGRLKRGEWAAILGVTLFMLGVMTTTLHKVPSPWLGLAILFGILLFGALNRKQFQQSIDWPFLIYLAGIIGIASAIEYLGLGQTIAARLPWLGETMHSNFSLFVLLLSGFIFIMRLAVPISATVVILATVLLPIAVHYGVNPWVVGFIILLLGDMWFFPYQCSYYLQFRQLTKGEIFDERAFLRFNALFNVLKILAIYASMSYWKSLGLL